MTLMNAEVMTGVMKALQFKVRTVHAGSHDRAVFQIPKYIRTDRLIVLHRQGTPRGAGISMILIEVISQHGFQCPLPAVESITLRLETSSDCHKATETLHWPFAFRTRNRRSRVESAH